eukprot:46676-Prymnesium_polylepis.2
MRFNEPSHHGLHRPARLSHTARPSCFAGPIATSPDCAVAPARRCRQPYVYPPDVQYDPI